MENLVGSVLDNAEGLHSEILRQIPTPVMAVNQEMKIIYVNDKAEEVLNMDFDEVIGKSCAEVFRTIHCGANECCMRKAMEEKKTFSARNEMIIAGEKTPIEYYAVPFIDANGEVKGGLEFILNIKEQVTYEKKLKEQSNTIQELSTPILKLWEGVLMLPIVGVVDSYRAQNMMEKMLIKISETSSQIIVLDIQGVAAVDTAVANHLIKITKATKLMGCECILSGISPAVAQTIVHLGIDMHSILTKSTLSDAVEEAFRLMSLKVETVGDQ